MACCLAGPTNPRAVGPRVLHFSRCPNVNPQDCPELWPETQHSLLTPNKPLGCCQVPAGKEVGKGRKRKRRKGCVEAAKSTALASGSQLVGRPRCLG